MRKIRFSGINNGFTLIELLAIIVILAIIAVITVPLILGVIDDSEKGAAKASAYGYKDSVQKWYVRELSQGSDVSLDGLYIVSDGKLNNIDIPLSGNKPTNGTLTYSNNILTGGCLTIGHYKATFDLKGNVSNVEKGECEVPQETVLYYTYDSTAEYDDDHGNISSKLPEPDSSWKYYIKETTVTGIPSYTIEYVDDGHDVGYTFETLSDCNTTSSFYSDNVRCVETNKKVFSEVCGVESGTTFCLKGNDYANSVQSVAPLFPGCNIDSSSSSFSCFGTDVVVGADPYGTIQINIIYDGISEYQYPCYIFTNNPYCGGG